MLNLAAVKRLQKKTQTFATRRRRSDPAASCGRSRGCGEWLAVGIACHLVVAGLASAAPWAGDSEAAQESKAYAVHDYTVWVRPALWTLFVDGGYETEGPTGNNISIRVDGDLGYDAAYPTFNGELGFRWGRHDFWISGTRFDETEDRLLRVEFEINGEVFDIGGIVDSEASITDVNFRYGYSFFEFEEDGFRLGPTLAVSYTDISVEVTEVTVAGIPTGTRFRFKETLPVPTLGLHAEVPYKDFLLSPQIGAFYASTSDLEATGMRAAGGVTWQAFRHIGLFVGINCIYADLELSNETVDDLVLWGPLIGLEARY